MAGHFFTTIENTITGKPVANATLEVFTSSAIISGSISEGYSVTGTYATIFSDDGVTQVDQDDEPVTSNSNGYVEFWTNETSVVLLVSYDGVGKMAISDVEIVGGSINSDLTALSVRVDNIETDITSIEAELAIRASTTEQLTGTDTTKPVTSDSVAALWEQGSDVASAGTVSLGEGGYFNITGTTTITDIDFATDKAGRKAWVKFAGALTLTHNASTLILPGGASITTVAGDTACFVSEGSDVVRCVTYQRASGAALASSGSYIAQGTHTIPVPANAMLARTSNGAASGTAESSSNKVMTRTLDFDQSTDEFAQVSIPMPKSWNEGTVTVQFVWTAGATGDVVWGAQAQYQRDDDPIDGAWGTAQTVTDSVTASGDRMVSSFTSAITPAGTGGNECSLLIQVYRDADNGSDTLAADAKLIAIRVKYTVNASDDT